MVAVSVVVIAKDFRPSLGALIESLDQQSMPTSDFEVIMVDLGSTDGTVERLRQMTTHRPNLRLIETTEEAAEAVRWLAGCKGEYVMRLRPDQVLLPQALERMHALASPQGLDAVSARVSQKGAPLQQLFTSDQEEAVSGAAAQALAGAAVAVKRSLLPMAADQGPESLPGAPRVGILASYPALVQPLEANPEDPAPTPRLRQDQPLSQWVDGKLQITATGVVIAESPRETDLSRARSFGLLRNTKTGLSYLLGPGNPVRRIDESLDNAASDLTEDALTEGALTEERGGSPSPSWCWDLSVEVDVDSAALGSPLPHGVWEIDVHLVDVDGTHPAPITVSPITVSWTACPPAVVGESIVVPSPTVTPTLQLDVGPTTWPLITAIDPAGATVTESAAGSMLVIPLPHVYVRGSSRISGQIALDQLRLRAQIVTDGSSARLEAAVSGLFGSPNISAQFGDTPMKPTGLSLDISGLGAITVSKAKPAAKKPAGAASTKKSGTSKPAVTKPVAETMPTPAKTRIQVLRRAVPESLEPLIKQIARIPIARQLYRKAGKL